MTSHSQPCQPFCLGRELREVQQPDEPESREARLEAHLTALLERMEELEEKNWQSRAYKDNELAQVKLEHTFTTLEPFRAQNAKGEIIDLLCSTLALYEHHNAQPCRLEPDDQCGTSQAPPQQDVWSRPADFLRQLNALHDSWPHRCHDCSMKFQIERDLEQHRKSKHD